MSSEKETVVIEHKAKLKFDDVHEVRADFCHEDGELGEFAERSIILRYKNGLYVLWNPEYQKIGRATSVQGALSEVKILLAQDKLTSVKVWQEK